MFLYETQGLVAQDILTESLQQRYNCHNNVKSEVQEKFIILQVKMVLKSMLGSGEGF